MFFDFKTIKGRLNIASFIICFLFVMTYVYFDTVKNERHLTEHLPQNTETSFYTLEFLEYTKNRGCSMVALSPWTKETVQIEFFMPTAKEQFRKETFSTKYFIHNEFDITKPVKIEKKKMYDNICEFLNMEYTVRSKMNKLKVYRIYLKHINFWSLDTYHIRVDYFIVEHWKTETIVDFSN